MADELSRGKIYGAARRPSDGAMAEGQREKSSGRGQAILAPGLIQHYRVALESAPAETVTKLLGAVIDAREAGVPTDSMQRLTEAVLDSLTRIPAKEVAARLLSLGEKLAIDVRRSRPPVG